MGQILQHVLFANHGYEPSFPEKHSWHWQWLMHSWLKIANPLSPAKRFLKNDYQHEFVQKKVTKITDTCVHTKMVDIPNYFSINDEVLLTTTSCFHQFCQDTHTKVLKNSGVRHVK